MFLFIGMALGYLSRIAKGADPQPEQRSTLSQNVAGFLLGIGVVVGVIALLYLLVSL